MNVKNKEEHEWQIAFRGLQRFFDEGMTDWTKEKFILLFSSETVALGSYVMGRLTELSKSGYITVNNDKPPFIKIHSL